MANLDNALKRLDERMKAMDDRIRGVVGVRDDPEIGRAIEGVRAGAVRGIPGTKIGLAVGLPFVDKNAYGGTDQPCVGCDFDAGDFSKILEAAGFDTTLLLSASATRAGVLTAMQAAADRLEAGGLFVMSIAGHGARRPVPEDGNRPHEYWCLWDGMLIDNDIVAAVKRFRPGVRIVMINDQCHCGGIFTSERGELPMLIQFAACRAEQASLGTQIGGTWTTALMKVLAVDREITWKEWFDKAVKHPSLTRNQSPQWVEIGPVTDAFRNERIFGEKDKSTTKTKVQEDNMKLSVLAELMRGVQSKAPAPTDEAEPRATKKFCNKCGVYTWVEGNYTGNCRKCGRPFADAPVPAEDEAEPRATKKFCNKCGVYTWVEGNYTGNCRKCGAPFANGPAADEAEPRAEKRFCRKCGTYTWVKDFEVAPRCRNCDAYI